MSKSALAVRRCSEGHAGNLPEGLVEGEVMTRYQIAFHRSDNYDPSEDEAMVVGPPRIGRSARVLRGVNRTETPTLNTEI
jgi:hypothetical protein